MFIQDITPFSYQNGDHIIGLYELANSAHTISQSWFEHFRIKEYLFMKTRQKQNNRTTKKVKKREGKLKRKNKEAQKDNDKENTSLKVRKIMK